MFDNIDFKVKGDNLVISTVGVLGKDKLCTIPLDKVKDVKWEKEPKVALATLLIKKGKTELAVALG